MATVLSYKKEMGGRKEKNTMIERSEPFQLLT